MVDSTDKARWQKLIMRALQEDHAAIKAKDVSAQIAHRTLATLMRIKADDLRGWEDKDGRELHNGDCAHGATWLKEETIADDVPACCGP